MTRLFGNFDFALSMLDELETSSDKDLMAIRDAADQQDSHATAEAAHALRGAAGILCATTVQQAAAKIEATARTGDMAEIASQVDNLAQEIRHCLDSLPTIRQRILNRQIAVAK